MTQIDEIRRIIRQFATGELISTQEIIRDTKIKSASVRRVTQSLVRTGEISRIEPGLFSVNRGRLDDVPEEEFHQKFIGTQKYGGDSRQFFALTFEDNDTDRETELIEALDGFLNQQFVDAAGNTGYSDEVIEAPNTQFIYPSIQVGQL